MKAPKLERRIKDKLAGIGIDIKPRTAASRTLKEIARVSADVANSSEEALRLTRTKIEEFTEAVRSSVHAATAPRTDSTPRKPASAKARENKPQS